jgi:hypothetical protein
MIADLDIWRAANLLIRNHGPDAELATARRADLMQCRPRAADWIFDPSSNGAISTGRSCGNGLGGQSLSCRPRDPARRIELRDDLVMAIPNLSPSFVLRLNIHG